MINMKNKTLRKLIQLLNLTIGIFIGTFIAYCGWMAGLNAYICAILYLISSIITFIQLDLELVRKYIEELYYGG